MVFDKRVVLTDKVDNKRVVAALAALCVVLVGLLAWYMVSPRERIVAAPVPPAPFQSGVSNPYPSRPSNEPAQAPQRQVQPSNQLVREGMRDTNGVCHGVVIENGSCRPCSEVVAGIVYSEERKGCYMPSQQHCPPGKWAAWNGCQPL